MTPLETSLAYFHAWTTDNPDSAWGWLSEDVVCHSPDGLLQGRSAVAAFMGPFAAMLTRATLLASHGDSEHAVVVYDTATGPVASAPGAELHTVIDGTIREIRIIFDRLPFALARGEVVQAAP